MHCNISATVPKRCFNTSGLHGGLLSPMWLGGRDADRLSLESCAAECSWAWNWTGVLWEARRTNATVGGVQLARPAAKHKSATDRCSCGTVASITTDEARTRQRKLTECTSNCTGDRTEACGSKERMLAFSFACSDESPENFTKFDRRAGKPTLEFE
jgi:hypothetical protein